MSLCVIGCVRISDVASWSLGWNCGSPQVAPASSRPIGQALPSCAAAGAHVLTVAGLSAVVGVSYGHGNSVLEPAYPQSFTNYTSGCWLGGVSASCASCGSVLSSPATVCWSIATVARGAAVVLVALEGTAAYSALKGRVATDGCFPQAAPPYFGHALAQLTVCLTSRRRGKANPSGELASRSSRMCLCPCSTSAMLSRPCRRRWCLRRDL